MLNLTLERIERQIRHLPVEHAYGFSPDYRLLFHATSDAPDRVSLPVHQPDLLLGAIVTHNHPGGRSFSRVDVDVTRRYALDELRVVTAQYRYSLKPPPDGWRAIAEEEFNRVIDREEDLLNSADIADIRRGALTAWLGNRTFRHRLWERVANLGLIRYRAEKW